MKQLACGILLILFASCTREMECRFTYQHLPAPLGIVGFDRADVDTIYVEAYKANTNFSNRVRIDTIDTRSMTATQDTLVFYSVSLFEDYIVTIPAKGTQYRISELYDPATDYSWTTKETCPHGRSGVSMPDQATINGKKESAICRADDSLPFGTCTFYLKN